MPVKMDRVIKFNIILFLVVSTKLDFKVLATGWSEVAQAFYTCEIVPDVILIPPDCDIQVCYPSGVEVKLGNILTPTLVKDEPTVSWNADPHKYYVLVMTDPDVPCRKEPTEGEFNHWLVGNIPGSNVAAGETLAEYIGSAPPPGTDLHRYVFLVYEQPWRLFFDEPRLTNTSADHRRKFSIAKFAAKYNLGNPVAGNYYQAEYDDYVPIIYALLGEEMPLKYSTEFYHTIYSAKHIPELYSAKHGYELYSTKHGHELYPAKHGHELYHAIHGHELHHAKHCHELHHVKHGHELHHVKHGHELHHVKHGHELHHGKHGHELHHGKHGHELHHAKLIPEIYYEKLKYGLEKHNYGYPISEVFYHKEDHDHIPTLDEIPALDEIPTLDKIPTLDEIL